MTSYNDTSMIITMMITWHWVDKFYGSLAENSARAAFNNRCAGDFKTVRTVQQEYNCHQSLVVTLLPITFDPALVNVMYTRLNLN